MLPIIRVSTSCGQSAVFVACLTVEAAISGDDTGICGKAMEVEEGLAGPALREEGPPKNDAQRVTKVANSICGKPAQYFCDARTFLPFCAALAGTTKIAHVELKKRSP